MQRYQHRQEFSFGEPKVEVDLTGWYSELDDQGNDNVRTAITASLIRLSTYQNELSISSQGQSGRQESNPTGSSAHAARSTDKGGTTSRGQGNSDITDDNGDVTARFENSNGSVAVRLTVENVQKGAQNRVPPQVVRQQIVDAICGSIVNHADAAITNTPPRNDALVQLLRYGQQTAQSGMQQRSLVGSASGSSR